MRSLYPALPFILALAIASGARGEGIAVAIDHSARLNVRGAAANVVVGNPAIADVSVLDSHTLYVSGRAYGSTDIVVTDPAGRTLFSGEVAVTRSANDVTVYRGAMRSDFSCMNGCTADARADSKGGEVAPGAGASTTSTSFTSVTTSAKP